MEGSTGTSTGLDPHAARFPRPQRAGPHAVQPLTLPGTTTPRDDPVDEVSAQHQQRNGDRDTDRCAEKARRHYEDQGEHVRNQQHQDDVQQPPQEPHHVNQRKSDEVASGLSGRIATTSLRRLPVGQGWVNTSPSPQPTQYPVIEAAAVARQHPQISPPFITADDELRALVRETDAVIAM
jgi:hypothetical protein